LLSFIISAIKIIFLLGFLIFIHEGGHFLVAKLCKVKVNQFAIGFGPEIFSKTKGETKYAIRLIPLGGFVSMEGEEEESEKEGAFNKASIPKRIAIVAAGAIVNIIFGLLVYFILILTIYGSLGTALDATADFSVSLVDSVKMLFTGKVGADDLTGPVGISELVSKTSGFREYAYILAIISVSLGVTNLLPIPALDGGKILLLIIEAIRRKPLKDKTAIQLQLIGFSIIIALSIFVTYNDIIRILGGNIK
jgi:regulator of sigma E protease